MQKIQVWSSFSYVFGSDINLFFILYKYIAYQNYNVYYGSYNMKESGLNDKKSEATDDFDKKKAADDNSDTEFSTDIMAEDFINTKESWTNDNEKKLDYINEIQALPQHIKILIVISWICAALAGFVSVYFAILGIIAAYAANRIVPGVGRAALITNVILAVINLALSYAFLQTVRNIFAIM